MLGSIFSSTGATAVEMLIATIASLVLGPLAAMAYRAKNRYSKSFVVTMALLPVMVQAVIMLVNGNLGAGVAVVGAFSLVRFRSLPGNARDIAAIFYAMAIGLATGMGYVAFAAIFTVVVGGAMILYSVVGFGEKAESERVLRITIPEDLDYNGVFDDLLDRYSRNFQLERVRTVNMGSLYELRYSVVMKESGTEKELLDAIRTRNGNLNVSLGREEAQGEL
ncbi:MAG: DUF4956 domain-containing protein [Oscillospiraceae bacterium]